MPGTALAHLDFLSRQIGPRGSTTESEREAAEYARKHFGSLGLETHVEQFTSPRTGWRQFFLASLFTLIAVVIGIAGGQAGALLAGLIALVCAVSAVLELYYRPNLLRLFVPKGISQNVWAKIPSAEQTIQRALVLAHIDTHRTPWVFETPSRLLFFRVISSLGILAFAVISILFFASAVTGLDWLRWTSMIFFPLLLAGLILTWQADRTLFTQGANDNGSGSSIVLSLADQLSGEPLKNLELWLLITGCEEVGAYGAQAFVAEHKHELAGFQAINIDNVGGVGAGVCYISLEGMLIRYKASPLLFSLADEIRAGRPGDLIYTKTYTTLHTDGTCLMTHGIPSLSFVGLTPEGRIPEWHRRTDTVERINPDAVSDVDSFVLEMLRRLDGRLAKD